MNYWLVNNLDPATFYIKYVRTELKQMISNYYCNYCTPFWY